MLKPPTFFLIGPPGSGKSTALVTFIKAGVELFVLGTEPGFEDSLLDACKLHGADINKLHYHFTPPVAASWSSLTSIIQMIGAMGYKDLAELKSGIDKGGQISMMSMLKNLQNFRDDRTGLEFGDVTEWGPDRCFVLDSLSGLNMIAQAHTVGLKPAMHQGEWGVAMNLEEQLILKLTADCKCFFGLTAHIEREPDEITGSVKITAGALGRKLGPKLPRFFSEVIRAERSLAQGNKMAFTWRTIDNEADLKNRALPVGINLAPSFEPVVKAYRDRVLLAQSGSAASPAAPAPATPGNP